ncbi:MAG: anaerobic ribonucleoside-triphosphate reductase activating protein [Deltaproteobacteria bacterium]|nr:MAG: anaerobic ribonucleoside-triphosphate reductase activating protein [Deltaproteobacteria bacterium]
MELLERGIMHLPLRVPQVEIKIKGFMETSFVDWSGKVVSVLFLPGCNFRCPFCHNHSLVLNPEAYDDIPFGHILDRLAKLKGWVDGVCITGGEPTIHPHLNFLIKEIKDLGLLVKLDTNGSRPYVLRSLVEEDLVDFVAMDIKAPLDEVNYTRASGVPVDLEKITESISFLKKGQVAYQFRITAVPALHREEDLLKLARQLRRCSSLTLQNFDPHDPLDESLKEIPPYPDEWIREMGEKINSILNQGS